MNVIDSPEIDAKLLYHRLSEGQVAQVIKELGTDPQVAEQRAVLGLALAYKRDFRRAEEILNSITLEGDWIAGVKLEAELMINAVQVKKPEDLRNKCWKILTLHPQAFQARIILASLLARSDPDRAQTMFSALVREYPKADEARFALARYWLEMGGREDAWETIQPCRDFIRRWLYILIGTLFSHWVVFTASLALLMMLVFSAVTAFPARIALSISVLIGLVYGYRLRDPLIFYFFISTGIVLGMLILGDWMF